ncbi:MAG: protein kinase [Phycisphaerales bacterium]|nr:protein kinase [Phycisphaerales bacterium]
MIDAKVQSFVSALFDRRALDDDILRLANELFQERDAIDRVRQAWPDSDLPIIANYLCCKRLGHGSSGVVFKALRFNQPPEWVALKVLRHVTDQDTVRFIEREVEILKALECPNVARYLDSGHYAGSHYLAMELVEGIPLDEYVQDPSLSIEDRLRVFERVCSVIAEVHEQGVVHRDLTPRHLLIDSTGQPKLVDFGLSAVQTEEWATHIRKTQTQLGRIMGTVKYMSPEQTWGGMMPIDHGCDIWALGVMLYEIATEGDYPYSLEAIEGKTATDSLLHRIQHEVPRKPRIPYSRYANGLATLISRCLAAEPRQRINSARQLTKDIASLYKSDSIETRPLPIRYRLQRIAVGLMLRSRTAVWMLIIAFVVATIYAGTLKYGVDFGNITDAHSTGAQANMIKKRMTDGPIDFAIVGIGDDTTNPIIEFARSNGIQNVTQDIKSWRPVHGHLMSRLANEKPRAIVWDFYFQTEEPGDAEFVNGIRRLDEAGVPVALGSFEYDESGKPKIASTIYEPLREVIHHGLIYSRNMVDRPGEFIIALQRGDRTIPSLALATLGGLFYPHLQSDVSWVPRTDTLTVQHRIRGTEDYIRDIDQIQVITLPPVNDRRMKTEVGDRPATKVFDLVPLKRQQARTIPYEKLLNASDDQLRMWVGGKVVVFIDVRSPGRWPWQQRDLHSVRYPTGVVHNVPGGYLMANAIEGIVSSHSVNRRYWLPFEAYSMIVGMAIVGCLLANLISRRGICRTLRSQLVTVAMFAGFTAICTVLIFDSSAREFTDWAIGGAAAGSTVILALWVEYVRNQYRFPRSPNPSSESW